MKTAPCLRRIIGLSVLLLAVLAPPPGLADDAVVLPKGVGRLWNETQFYLSINQRYNKNGDKEDIAKDFNANLNSSIFPALAGFGPGATIGQSVVSMTWDIQSTLFQPAYGITDRFTVGANIPYFWQKNTVTASLNTSAATVGKSPASPFPFTLAPCFAPGCATGGPIPGTTALTAADAQNLLVSQGFKPLQTWEEEGFGDIEVGGKYQYARSESFRAAMTAGVRFPTGQVDDPDNLADRGFGSGAYALLFRFQQDFMDQPDGLAKRLGFPGVGSYFVNTTFRYDWYLPDTQELRVCDVHNPLCSNKETVDRKIGDIMEAEISGAYGFLFKGLFISPLYKYTYKFKDSYSGSRGLEYGVLANESDFYDHSFRISLSYSTVPLVVERKFSYPLAVSVFYQDRFAGNNNRFVTKSIGFNIAAFF